MRLFPETLATMETEYLFPKLGQKLWSRPCPSTTHITASTVITPQQPVCVCTQADMHTHAQCMHAHTHMHTYAQCMHECTHTHGHWACWANFFSPSPVPGSLATSDFSSPCHTHPQATGLCTTPVGSSFLSLMATWTWSMRSGLRGWRAQMLVLDWTQF